jgi:hypothetical protein
MGKSVFRNLVLENPFLDIYHMRLWLASNANQRKNNDGLRKNGKYGIFPFSTPYSLGNFIGIGGSVNHFVFVTVFVRDFQIQTEERISDLPKAGPIIVNVDAGRVVQPNGIVDDQFDRFSIFFVGEVQNHFFLSRLTILGQ